MTDKKLSERVAEHLQMSESYGFSVMRDTELIREQQAENEKLLLDWIAEQGRRSDAEWQLEQVRVERDRLRAENEALRAELEASYSFINARAQEAGDGN